MRAIMLKPRCRLYIVIARMCLGNRYSALCHNFSTSFDFPQRIDHCRRCAVSCFALTAYTIDSCRVGVPVRIDWQAVYRQDTLQLVETRCNSPCSLLGVAALAVTCCDAVSATPERRCRTCACLANCVWLSHRVCADSVGFMCGRAYTWHVTRVSHTCVTLPTCASGGVQSSTCSGIFRSSASTQHKCTVAGAVSARELLRFACACHKRASHRRRK